MGGLISVMIAAAELLYPEALPRFFTEDQSIVDKVENVLWVIAVMQPINGLVNVGAGVLQGAQDFTYQVSWWVGGLVGLWIMHGLLSSDGRRLNTRAPTGD